MQKQAGQDYPDTACLAQDCQKKKKAHLQLCVRIAEANVQCLSNLTAADQFIARYVGQRENKPDNAILNWNSNIILCFYFEKKKLKRKKLLMERSLVFSPLEQFCCRNEEDCGDYA